MHKKEGFRIGDEVSDELFQPKTMGQFISMIKDYGNTHGLTAAEISKIFSAGIAFVLQTGAASMLMPTTPAAVLRQGLILIEQCSHKPATASEETTHA
ncbi:hypothetical protein D3C86_1802250 [compost metagenome]